MFLIVVKAFFAIFGVMDPLGNIPVFLSLTKDFDDKKRNLLAKKAIIRAGLILLIFVFLGTAILDFFHISLESFRIAGGLILTLIGIQVLFNINFTNNSPEKIEDISAVPLATPLIAGPGMITTAIIFSREYGQLVTIIAIIANLLITWFLFNFANNIFKFLGYGGSLIAAKIIGLILVAIGIEFIRSGLL